MRAVVETENIARRSTISFGAISQASLRVVGDGLHARNQPFRGFLPPITGNQRPHDRAVAQFTACRNDPGIPQSKWRAKPFRRRTQRIGNRVVAEAKFNPDLSASEAEKIRMCLGRLADG